MINPYVSAIRNLVPDAEFAVQDSYESVVWLCDLPQPSKADVEAEVVRLEAEYEATEYRRFRSPEYPAIGDQLDALYHAGVFPEDMAAQIAAVKEKYPKPEEA